MKKYFLTVLCLVMLLFALTSAAFAEETYEYADVVSGNVTVNGISVNTVNAVYPFLLHKDITYFPMTYHLCRFLGVETYWSQETGLSVGKTGVFSAYVPDEDRTGTGGFVSISFPQYVIEINGKRIDNSKEEWPLINYNGVTYFPLTWRFAVDEFGWEYSWTKETGLHINSGNPRDNSLENLLAVLNSDNFSSGSRDYDGSLLNKKNNELKPFEVSAFTVVVVPPRVSPYGLYTKLELTPFVFTTNAATGINVNRWGEKPYEDPHPLSPAVISVENYVIPAVSEKPVNDEFAVLESGYLLRCFLQMHFIGEERENIESAELISREGTVETWKLVARMPDNGLTGEDRKLYSELFPELVSDRVQITPVIDTATGTLLSMAIESENYVLKMVVVPTDK